jgi:hypothetical protein
MSASIQRMITDVLPRGVRALRDRLYAPVDIASLVAFRIMFGAIMVWEVFRYFDHDWIYRYYIDPDFHFTYFGFGWVKPLPGDGMEWHFLALGVLAACIAVGFLYRIAATLFFLGITYVFVLEQSCYLNHMYMVSLVSFLMIFVPAHRSRSLDSLIRRRLRSDTAPAWSLWLLRAQIGIVYFYAGLAKLNADWLQARPLNMWLWERRDDDILGPILGSDWAPWVFSYGGLLLDLFVVPLLLWRRTRAVALIAALGFHLTNAKMFSIGIFPWMMIAATLLFLRPDWPRRLLPASGPLSPVPGGGPVPRRAVQNATMTLLGVYLAVQVLFPFRHWLYPGVVHWTEEGHRFAWHMKLRSKSGTAKFLAVNRLTGETREFDPEDHLTKRQAQKMEDRPDMILQFAHHVARELAGEDPENIEVYAEVRVSLNGRPRQLLIDPTVDLSRQPRTLGHATWIMPLEQPLPPLERSGS